MIWIDADGVHLQGIKQVHTQVMAPKANAIAERWVRSIRNECLDHHLIFGHQHLQRTVKEYVDYYNRWRPHRSLDQKARCIDLWRSPKESSTGRLTATPFLSGLHHVYQWAA